MNLCPPSENRFYLFCETLFTRVNQHAAGEEYVVVIKWSQKTKKESGSAAIKDLNMSQKAIASVFFLLT